MYGLSNIVIVKNSNRQNMEYQLTPTPTIIATAVAPHVLVLFQFLLHDIVRNLQNIETRVSIAWYMNANHT